MDQEKICKLGRGVKALTLIINPVGVTSKGWHNIVTSYAFEMYCQVNGIEHEHISVETPNAIAHIEAF